MKALDKIFKKKSIDNEGYSSYFADKMAKMGIDESSYPFYTSTEEFVKTLKKVNIQKTSSHIFMSTHSSKQ